MDEPVLIQITGLDNSFIYFSNGTILEFIDGNLNITLEGDEYFYIVNYAQWLRFNSNNGTTAYDSSGNNNHGTISGATWSNDGVLVTLTNAVDYTLNTATGVLTLSSEYLYSWIETTWSYTYDNNTSDNTVLHLIELGIALAMLVLLALYIRSKTEWLS